jgi:hypothetical protein
MLTRQISLTVSAGFEVPLVFMKHHDVKAIEEALYLGATIQNLVRTKRSSDEVKKVSDLKDAEIQRIQGMYQEKVTKVLEEIRTVTEERDRLQQEYMERVKEARGNERSACRLESEEAIRALEREHEVLVGKYAALEASRRVLEESRERDVAGAIKRTEEMMERVVAAKQEQLTKMESAYQRLQESITRQTDEIAKLSGTMGKRRANVSVKGADYEVQFGAALRRWYGVCRGFALRDTRLGSGHEMDFSMDVEGHVVMWELKNYSSVVPKAEVDKFLRDLKEAPQASIGVMISRSTDIQGKSGTGGLWTEFEGEKMMVYVNRFEEFCGEDEGKVFQMLMALFRVWWNYYRDETGGWEREEVVREVEKMVEEVSKRRTEWRRHKAHLEEVGRWMGDVLEDAEYRLDRVLRRVRGGGQSQVASLVGAGVGADEEKTRLEVPAGIFRETKDERDMGWVQSILRVCEPASGSEGQMEVRELVELLAAHHKLSRDTLRGNVMSVLRDEAIGKKGPVKFVRGLVRRAAPCMIQMPSASS